MSGNPASHPRLEDWVIIWHSEIAGLVADPETTETVLSLIDLWAEGARKLAQAYDQAYDRAYDQACARAADDAAVPPPRPPAPAAAPDERPPDERDRLIARLLERVDELERRLDGLSPPRGPSGDA